MRALRRSFFYAGNSVNMFTKDGAANRRFSASAKVASKTAALSDMAGGLLLVLTGGWCGNRLAGATLRLLVGSKQVAVGVCGESAAVGDFQIPRS